MTVPPEDCKTPTTGAIVRPSTAPDFLLSRAHGSVRTQGTRQSFTTAAEAVAALRSGAAELVVGALPFRLGAPAALVEPEKVIREPGYLTPPPYYAVAAGAPTEAFDVVGDAPVAGVSGQAGDTSAAGVADDNALDTEAAGSEPPENASDLPTRTPFTGASVRIAAEVPSPDEHQRRVAEVVRRLQAGDAKKVVLARAVDVEFEQPVDSRLLAARLIFNAHGHDGFMADLSAAGEEFRGAVIFGSSPEMLIRRQGNEVTAFPLAGSMPRVEDPEEDRRRGEQLLHSTKDLTEHRYVVDHYRRVLARVCDELEIPDSPQLMCTTEMWHLATPIRGRLAAGDSHLPTALDLAEMLHPTPAVGGTPTDAALRMIRDLEGDRGFYAGAVGYCGASGDGEFMVTIRCAQLDATHRHARAWAGGGIVADSDPAAEVAETRGKLRTALRSMGVAEAD